MSRKLLAAVVLILAGATALLYAAISELNGHALLNSVFAAILFGSIFLLVGITMLRTEMGDKL